MTVVKRKTLKGWYALVLAFAQEIKIVLSFMNVDPQSFSSNLLARCCNQNLRQNAML
jgi:hypothetical protein